MNDDEKATPVPSLLSAPRLVTALNQSVQVRDKVEECVQELSLITGVLTQEVAERVSLDVVEQALHHSEEVEIKVQECADDLSFVNETLTEEIRERRKLESKFAEIKGELADAQSDLSDSLTKEQHARHLSLHDGLTGLPNRSLFNDRLENALALAKRHSWRLAVMFIDLDKFKSVNDTYGHHAGDQVLEIVAERLEAAVRGADTIGRRGGDEFLYLMLEVKDDIDVGHAARKILETIARPCEFDGLSLTVRPSIGIALFPEDGTSAGELLQNADNAMYKAKQKATGFWFHKLRN
ncbi:MAG TPA: GGDEF domain-containing protein [Burkholderiales bacterium]|nr:GGDEF domain-containing protein [Burkholderiales bacterium]